MAEELSDTATSALIRLASAQDRMAEDMTKLMQQMREMNGSIRDHNTRLALGKQWIEHHVGDDSVHDVMRRRLDAIEKLAKTAIAIPTIIVIGGAIAGIVTLLR